MNINNATNPYMYTVYSNDRNCLYTKCPKSVFAAIAISSLTVGGDKLDEARDRVLAEWWTLYDNQIVSQRPPFPRPEAKE